jgi:hypothetical protein
MMVLISSEDNDWDLLSEENMMQERERHSVAHTILLFITNALGSKIIKKRSLVCIFDKYEQQSFVSIDSAFPIFL